MPHAGRCLDPRLRAARQADRRNRDPDDLAAAAGRAAGAARQALQRDREARRERARLRRHGPGPARASGFSAPADLRRGSRDRASCIIEDLGSRAGGRRRRPDPGALRGGDARCSRELHAHRAAARCCRSPTASSTRCRPTISRRLLIEVELLLDWYVPHIIGTHAVGLGAGGVRQCSGRRRLDEILAAPADLDLARLPFAEPDLAAGARADLQRVGLIDFQDAVLGPPGLRRRLAPAGRARDGAGRARAEAHRPLCARAARRRSRLRRDGLRPRLRDHGRAARHQGARHLRPPRPARRQAAIPAAPAAHRGLSRPQSRASGPVAARGLVREATCRSLRRAHGS